MDLERGNHSSSKDADMIPPEAEISPMVTQDPTMMCWSAQT